jgi:hypothetical protein
MSSRMGDVLDAVAGAAPSAIERMRGEEETERFDLEVVI